MSLWSSPVVAVAVLVIALPAITSGPVQADHAVANRVYAEPTDESGKPIIHYVELDKAASGGRVRIFMGDGHVVCLNGPVGFAMAPATQSGYVALEWRGCNPNNPVSTFTYQLESRAEHHDESVAVGVADAYFPYDYGAPGVYRVDWRAGTGAGGSGYIVVV